MYEHCENTIILTQLRAISKQDCQLGRIFLIIRSGPMPQFCFFSFT